MHGNQHRRLNRRSRLRQSRDAEIENTGPLTVKRMGTIDDEFTDAALAWMDTQAKAGKPFFCYYNSTRMHVFTHFKPESEGKTGLWD